MSTLTVLREEMDQACKTAGRAPNSVRVLAVSKLQSIEKIRELMAQGQTEFGENYVQELLKKMTDLPDRKVRWHLIGHLQKNKVKQIAGRCALIHSVDSVELAQTIAKFSLASGVIQDILFQINLADEDSKDGFSREEFLKTWPALAKIDGLRIQGLMTMPPLQNQPEQNRKYFAELRELMAAIKENSGGHPLRELSMGTSHDFNQAILEGATLIRVGTRLFGERI